MDQRPPHHAKSFRVIDLFSGAGGLSLGFVASFPPDFHPAVSSPSPRQDSRFEPIYALDSDADAVATYNSNLGSHAQCARVEEVVDDPSVVPRADVVIGGPPCQGFSLLNRSRGDDQRRQLWLPFMDIVRLASAKVFLMENVEQLLDSSEHREIERAAALLGFRVVSARLCAADYGVPQLRRRAFLLGTREECPEEVFPPPLTHVGPKMARSLPFCDAAQPQPWRTVADWLRDLPQPAGTDFRDEPPPLDLHFGRSPTPLSQQRYRLIPDEGADWVDLRARAPHLIPNCWKERSAGSGTDVFGRLWWDRPAPTIRAEFHKPEKGRYLHPEQHRPLTHREAARLQSFPDWFRFCGTKASIARQIGNAVPPLIAARLADSVYRLLTRRSAN